ncbi:hypothetical protein SNOG_05143 [Parastagonospora nodorum SN15]|uniref:Uncharacterized protein n=1 Tax=Phaeosphaeria nodorum (strain SN15 / ATCC MYA-4574 / FGSC 10173) TaxID=321614 RepID=Q0USX1_PHANO|nr:hypothetical protein SNOG_05143 [Parastagonospora nodorum SN15]EAT87534.1 hypothetical protein SNOG_05143 [Parastagonospora nodorum SN15]
MAPCDHKFKVIMSNPRMAIALTTAGSHNCATCRVTFLRQATVVPKAA